MAVEIAMPKWGLSMQEGTIGTWLKSDGDAVRQGEPVVVRMHAPQLQAVDAWIAQQAQPFPSRPEVIGHQASIRARMSSRPSSW